MGRFKYKDKFTEEEIKADAKRKEEEDKRKYGDKIPRLLTGKDYLRLSKEWFKLETTVNSYANSMDVPEKYWDFWFAYGHFDNDFDGYFAEAARELSEQYTTEMRSAVLNYAWHTYNKKEGEEITYPAPTLEKYLDDVFERELRAFRDEDTLEKIIRTSVALKAGIKDVNNQSFDKEFNNILNYFKPGTDGREHCYIGKKRVFEFLNEVQYNSEKIKITPENYKNCWWNGDVMVCHISGEKVDIL